MEVPLKIKLSAIPLLGIYTKEMKSDIEETSAVPCSLQHYSQ